MLAGGREEGARGREAWVVDGDVVRFELDRREDKGLKSNRRPVVVGWKALSLNG